MTQREEWSGSRSRLSSLFHGKKKYLTLNLNSNSKEKEDDLEEEGVEV